MDRVWYRGQQYTVTAIRRRHTSGVVVLRLTNFRKPLWVLASNCSVLEPPVLVRMSRYDNEGAVIKTRTWSARCECYAGHNSSVGRCNVREVTDPAAAEGGPVLCERCRAECCTR